MTFLTAGAEYCRMASACHFQFQRCSRGREGFASADSWSIQICHTWKRTWLTGTCASWQASRRLDLWQLLVWSSHCKLGFNSLILSRDIGERFRAEHMELCKPHLTLNSRWRTYGLWQHTWINRYPAYTPNNSRHTAITEAQTPLKNSVATPEWLAMLRVEMQVLFGASLYMQKGCCWITSWPCNHLQMQELRLMQCSAYPIFKIG